MRFSERIGKKKVKDTLQINDIDHDLMMGLWNLIYIFVFIKCPFDIQSIKGWESLFIGIWFSFFKKPIDEIPPHKNSIQDYIKKWFLGKACWYEIYDFIEFIYDIGKPVINLKEYKSVLNKILIQECSGYRFIEGKISPITNQNEIQAVEDALNNTDFFSGVSAHIQSALEKLSDKQNPDYRNSIKESISAVESICKVLTNNSSATLGEALRILGDKIDIHGALGRGFLNIYGYTNDENGIRHAMMENSPCDFDDAKYMLVSCSSFVNYLKAKANKAGLI